MTHMNALQELILELAVGGISAPRLKQAVSRGFLQLDEAQYQSALLGLQEIGHLVGEDLVGQWHFKTLDEAHPDYQPPEYSPEFAEKIIAASCEEFVEIDVDDFLAQLDTMIAKAKGAAPEAC